MKTNIQFIDFQRKYKIPNNLFNSDFLSITKTEDELSIVCPSTYKLASDKVEDNWSAIKVVGPLDFSLTGILAKISSVLAESKISIFAISTYDTDYILVKTEKLRLAISILESAKYSIIKEQNLTNASRRRRKRRALSRRYMPE